MRLASMYLVRFSAYSPGRFNPSFKTFWIRFTNGGWEPSDLFSPDCLVDKQKAEAFLRTPGLDSRYSIWKIELNALKEG